MSINKRHLAKTISWRFVGTLDTLVLSWIIAGSLTLGLKIGFFELITKMLLYCFHEKLWFNSKVKESNRRHLLKTFSWRFLATIDTIVLAAIISGNPFTGLKIGVAEVLTKMILYFFHEKLWYRINYGLVSRNNLKNFK